MTGPSLDPMTLGLALALLGMGGTLLTLYLLSLIASLLKRLFPLPPEPAAEAKADGAPPATPPPDSA